MRGVQMLDVQCAERVLEIGCGTGQALKSLAAHAGSTGRVFGLDRSSGMLDVAQKRLESLPGAKIALLQADAFSLPFPGGSFDVIFMSFTLELFPGAGIPLVLQECRRILRSGGRLGIAGLLQKERAGWMERAYNWAHRRWPRIIDCRPIPIEKVIKSAGFEISHSLEMSMWGLAVGVLVATKIRPPSMARA